MKVGKCKGGAGRQCEGCKISTHANGQGRERIVRRQDVEVALLRPRRRAHGTCCAVPRFPRARGGLHYQFSALARRHAARRHAHGHAARGRHRAGLHRARRRGLAAADAEDHYDEGNNKHTAADGCTNNNPRRGRRPAFARAHGVRRVGAALLDGARTHRARHARVVGQCGGVFIDAARRGTPKYHGAGDPDRDAP